MSFTGESVSPRAIALWLTLVLASIAFTGCRAATVAAAPTTHQATTVVALPSPTAIRVTKATSTPTRTAVLRTPTQAADLNNPPLAVTPKSIAVTPSPVSAIAAPGTAATPVAHSLFVGNTDGQGVYLRASPNLDDKLNAWPDGSTMTVLGASIDSSSFVWFNVRAPDGQVGWIPMTYLIPDQPTPTSSAPIRPSPSSPTPVAPSPISSSPTPPGSSQLSRNAIRAALTGHTNKDVLALLGAPESNLRTNANGMELWFYENRSVDPTTGRVDPWMRVIVNGQTGQVVWIDFWATT